MAGQDEEDYKFYGTPIEDEEETRAGQRRKEARDPAATRALPLHKQEATDEQGRRRFHGAFTGGFSAGYFNTVGSKEGWQPASFRSSRDERAAVQQSVEQYLDDDELEELRRTNLQTTAEYDTFGSTAAELARRAAADAAAERRSAIPSLMPDEMVVPVAESVGIRLLQRMGWRQGKGIGGGGDTPTAADEEAEQAAGGGGGGGEGRRRRWGQHASVAAENTPLHLLAPKTDLHGLGYDPFKGAEDFRRIKEQRRAADAPGQAAKKRRRGIAFGSGVLDEEDGYGEGTTMEDYVTHDDLGDYDGEVEAGGMPRSRAPKLRKSGLGDRLARKGYSFEIVDEEDEGPELLEWHQAKRQPQLALAGREAPLLLQSKEHSHGKGGLVPGFVRATATVVLAFFPPPRLPPGYVPVHRPSQAADEALPAAAARFAPPQADPPADAELRQAIDSLAFFVARNGIVFANMARQRQQKEGRWAFLSGGEGAAYYRWKMHSLQAIISPQQQQRRRAPPLLAIGQRPAPLSADERGALLGEAPLAGAAPATAGAALSGWATGAAEGQRAAAAAIAEGRQQEALRRQLLQVSQADRQRLQQLLSRNFVAAESSEMLQPDGGAAAAGLRPGAPPPPPRAPAAAAAPGRVVTERDLARPAEGGDLALRPGGGLGPGDAARAAAARRPVRRSEEWRPLPLLCKRFNVPDPYHGRPAELQMSRFKTDHLALPETAAAVAASLAAAPAGAQDFLLPPSVAAAIKEAEAQQALALGAGGGSTAAAAAPAAAAGPPQQQQPEDAAGAADAFLSSLSDMLGGGGGGAGAAQGEPAPPLPPGPPPPGDTGAAGDAEAAHVVAEAEAAERPVDLFKAIFEDSEEEEEEEEEEGAADATAHEQQGQQHPQGAQAPGSASGAAVEQQRGGPAVPADEGAAAQQAQRPQHTFQPPAAQQQRPAEDAAFGFAKLRAPTAALPPASAAAAAAIAAGGLDDATKQRVQEALRALRKDKKEKKGSKKKSKKEKKEKSKKSRHKGKRKKQRRRSDSSESSSESDSD